MVGASTGSIGQRTNLIFGGVRVNHPAGRLRLMVVDEIVSRPKVSGGW
jgi:hypothetical protein